MEDPWLCRSPTQRALKWLNRHTTAQHCSFIHYLYPSYVSLPCVGLLITMTCQPRCSDVATKGKIGVSFSNSVKEHLYSSYWSLVVDGNIMTHRRAWFPWSHDVERAPSWSSAGGIEPARLPKGDRRRQRLVFTLFIMDQHAWEKISLC